RVDCSASLFGGSADAIASADALGTAVATAEFRSAKLGSTRQAYPGTSTDTTGSNSSPNITAVQTACRCAADRRESKSVTTPAASNNTVPLMAISSRTSKPKAAESADAIASGEPIMTLSPSCVPPRCAGRGDRVPHPTGPRRHHPAPPPPPVQQSLRRKSPGACEPPVSRHPPDCDEGDRCISPPFPDA